MKQFLYKTCLFFALIVGFDVVFGFAMGYINDHIDIGGVGRDNYICNNVTDDIIIFGSSRAEHHYNAQMITDSVGASCYNCGEGGCGIILAYGRLLMLLERYTPKTIIYEVTPNYDFLDVGMADYQKYLYRLKQHYNRPGISDIFYDIDHKEKYKMMSGMYRYNSSWINNVVVFFLGKSTDTGVRGYRPFYGDMDPMKILGNDYILYDSKEGYAYDSLKLQYVDKFLEKTKDMDVVFVVSPVWYGQDSKVLEPMKKICKKWNTRLIDYTNDPKYVHNNQYFKDGTHLNSYGADEFTKDLINELRKEGFF